jgi:hypothetical protein
MVGEKAVLQWNEGTEKHRVPGRVASVRDLIITAAFSFPFNSPPPDYGREIKLEYRIEFIPNKVVFRRQALAIEYLHEHAESDIVRGDLNKGVEICHLRRCSHWFGRIGLSF